VGSVLWAVGSFGISEQFALNSAYNYPNKKETPYEGQKLPGTDRLAKGDGFS
jgi:hypothetical protein